VLVQIVLLNLLIAKLSDAYAKIKASSLLASNFQQVCPAPPIAPP
jgi:hypothetical protein